MLLAVAILSSLCLRLLPFHSSAALLPIKSPSENNQMAVKLPAKNSITIKANVKASARRYVQELFVASYAGNTGARLDGCWSQQILRYHRQLEVERRSDDSSGDGTTEEINGTSRINRIFFRSQFSFSLGHLLS